jgi:hypothetical protein
MKKIYYEKVGRRYKPVSEYDSDFLDSFAKGTHLVMVYPGGKSTRYNVEPNYAAMIAAGRLAEDAISTALMKASDLRMQRQDRERQITPEQKAAWEHLVELFGDSAKYLERPSIREIAEAGVQAMQEEAEKLMQHESVKQAYEHFMLMCELTKKHPVDQK